MRAYDGPRRSTWMTGVVLLICMIGLAFTGYLLPWDQLAYWAVTIGTSMAESIPLIGHQVNLLLRGSEGIGADGLLRFYLLHIAIIPLVCFLFLGIHYYRVSRLHGLAIPETTMTTNSQDEKSRQKANYLPEVFLREVFLIGFCVLLIGFIAQFFYDAPLEYHADPTHTPWNAEAPWYFLWLQGLLKIGDKTTMGVVIPSMVLLLALIYPYICNWPLFRLLQYRIISTAVLFVLVVVVIGLSYMGTHRYGIQLPPQIEITNAFLPLAGKGDIHNVSYQQLKAGIYETGKISGEDIPEELMTHMLGLESHLQQNQQAKHFEDPSAVVLIEEWQHQLKRITLRIQWKGYSGGNNTDTKSIQQIIHLHELNKIHSKNK